MKNLTPSDHVKLIMESLKELHKNHATLVKESEHNPMLNHMGQNLNTLHAQLERGLREVGPSLDMDVEALLSASGK